MNGVFVRELRPGSGVVGACCEEVRTGQLPSISSRGTCCIGALLHWDCQPGTVRGWAIAVEEEKEALGTICFYGQPLPLAQTFVPQPCHLFTSIDFATLPSSTALSSWHHYDIVPPPPSPCLGRRSSKPALSSKASFSNLTKPSLDHLSTCSRCLGLSSVKPPGTTSMICSRRACSPRGGWHPPTNRLPSRSPSWNTSWTPETRDSLS